MSDKAQYGSIRVNIDKLLEGLENHQREWCPKNWLGAEFTLQKRHFRTHAGRVVSLSEFTQNILEVQGSGNSNRCAITRSEVRRFFDIALEGIYTDSSLEEQSIRTAFVAMMAWGNGDTGYGPFRTAVALSLPTWDGRESMSALVEILRLFRKNSLTVEQTYSSLSGLLRAIGPAFFTKLMYFASPKSNRMPILDERVARALRNLPNLKFEVNGKHVKPQAQPASVGMYMAYVKWCEQFTSSGEGRRDIPEYVLFNPAYSNKDEVLNQLRLDVQGG